MSYYTSHSKSPVHPGIILADILEDRGITQKHLSSRLGISEKHMSEMVNGEVSFTVKMALLLERVLGTPADTWLNLQTNFDIITSRNNLESDLQQQYEAEKHMLSSFSDCYRSLQKWELVSNTLNRKERYFNLLDYFGVPSLNLFMENYSSSIKFRKTNVKPDIHCVAAWLRYGDKQYEARSNFSKFNPAKFEQLLQIARNLTSHPIKDSAPRLVDLCNEAGVTLVFTPYFSKSYINGATRWIAPSQPLIQLSEKNKRSDILWFTFFHEAAHLLLHSRKENFIDWDNSLSESLHEESEADTYARDILIPKNLYSEFLQHSNFSVDSIRHFAETIGVGPDILAGRLAFENIIDWSTANQFFNKIELRLS